MELKIDSKSRFTYEMNRKDIENTRKELTDISWLTLTGYNSYVRCDIPFMSPKTLTSMPY